MAIDLTGGLPESRELLFPECPQVDGMRDAVNMWVRAKQVARVVFGEMGIGLSPYPYALVFPQDQHERLLIARFGVLDRELLQDGRQHLARATPIGVKVHDNRLL